MESDELESFHVIRLQALVRTFLIRSKLLKGIAARYEKVYDPKRRRYYYYDKVSDKSSWVKPTFLLNKELPVAPTYSPLQAALRVQRAARAMLARLRVRLLYQQTLMKVSDESNQQEYYFNPKTGASMWSLPSFMNNRLDYSRKPAPSALATAAQLEAQESDTDSDASSLDSEARREKRRRRRKYPRSKAQELVDAVEDSHKTLVHLDLSHLGARHITSRIYDLTQLQSLNLSHNALRKLHADIQYLYKLRELDVSHNRLETLPLELRELTQLTDLNLSHNRLASFSAHLYKLVELRRLDLSRNRFEALPLEAGNLELLRELGLFEVGISRLSRLVYLDLSHCRLQAWPAQVQQLDGLRELYLSHNALPALPEDVGDLASLEIMHVDHNALRGLPAALLRLSLCTLHAQHNAIDALPGGEDEAEAEAEADGGGEACPLGRSLTALDLSHNRLARLDGRLARLGAALQRLGLAHNRLAATSDHCFRGLSRLSALDLAHNALEDLDPSLGQSGNLDSLALDHNRFRDVPMALLRCTRLRRMTLAHNQLAALNGRVVTMLTALEHLDCRGNRLTALPPLLFSLRRLVHVDLAHNALSALPDGIGHWGATLRRLDVSHNRLEQLPPRFPELGLLEELFLHRNRLAALPPGFARLQRLRRLTLHHNAFTSSPRLVGALPALRHCNLSHNPLRAAGGRDGRGTKADCAVWTQRQLFTRWTQQAEAVEGAAPRWYYCYARGGARSGPPSSAAEAPVRAVLGLCRKLHSFATEDRGRTTRLLHHWHTALGQAAQAPASPAQSLALLAHTLDACRQHQDHAKWQHVQKLLLRWKQPSAAATRWGRSELPSPSAAARLLRGMEETASWAEPVLARLPLGLEALDALDDCAQLLEHLHPHLLASELHYLAHTAGPAPAWPPLALRSALDFEPDGPGDDADRAEEGGTLPFVPSRATSPSPPPPAAAALPAPSPLPSQPTQNPRSLEFGWGGLFGRRGAEAKAPGAAAEAKAGPPPPGGEGEEEVSLPEVLARVQAELVRQGLDPWALLRGPGPFPGPGPRQHVALSPQLPRLHLPAHLLQSSYTCQTGPADGSYLWLSFEIMLFHTKLVLAAAEHLTRSIRWLERTTGVPFSGLDLAQRLRYRTNPSSVSTFAREGEEGGREGQGGGQAEEKEGGGGGGGGGEGEGWALDYADLLADVYAALTGEAQESARQQRQGGGQGAQGSLAGRRALLREDFYQRLLPALPPAGEGDGDAAAALSQGVGDEDQADPSLSTTSTPRTARAEDARRLARQSSTLHKLTGAAASLAPASPATPTHRSNSTLMRGKSASSPTHGNPFGGESITEPRASGGEEGYVRGLQAALEAPLPPAYSGPPAATVWIEGLLLYRKLLLLWALRSAETAGSVLAAQGLDAAYSDSLHPLPLASPPLPQREREHCRLLRRQGRRWALYRARVCQYLGAYTQSVQSYRLHLLLSQSPVPAPAPAPACVPQDTVVSYAKALLSLGHYDLARETLERLARDVLPPAGAADPSPVELFAVDEEVAVLLKFAHTQLAALRGAGVASPAQQRLHDLHPSGWIGPRRDYPPAEYRGGRAADYAAQWAQWRQHTRAQEAEHELDRSREELQSGADKLSRQAEEMVSRVTAILPKR